MKKYFFFAVALALSACTSDEYMGGVNPGEADGAIKFAPSGAAMTRATHVGADAANMLGKNFVVEGWKTAGTATSVWSGSSSTPSIVFDNYNVNWNENTAGTTESNTSDWEYVNQTKNSNSAVSSQTIKYWDHSTQQYDFYAYSLGNNGSSKATPTQETPGTATATTVATSEQATQNARAFVEGKGGAYTLTGTAAQLNEAYISDLVTVPNANYNKEVMLSFRNLAAKVRVAFYETIPGYSVRDVEFYADGTTTTKVTSDYVTLYSASNNIYTNGTYTVYFPTTDSETPTSDKNKAHVAFAASGDQKSTVDVGAALSYQRSQESTCETGSKYLGVTSNSATYTAAEKANAYVKVLPNEDASALTLRCNYTLVSNDGSKETIKVWGATAVVPAEYCQWKSNYAYTYIFKISDNTNGSTEALTGGGTDAVGLHPITFDAVVVDSEDGIQETVTTVATPSITTYQHVPATNASTLNEYKSGTVYAIVQNGADMQALTATNTKLYTIDNTHAATATEAEVMDALNMRTNTGDSSIKGRNGIVLTAATTAPTFTNTVPGEDGNNITLSSHETDIFAAEMTVSAGTYALVYTVTAASGSGEDVYTAVSVAKDDSLENYYTASWDGSKVVYTACESSATAPAAGFYYQKYTKNDGVYAVKVIKVVD